MQYGAVAGGINAALKGEQHKCSIGGHEFIIRRGGNINVVLGGECSIGGGWGMNAVLRDMNALLGGEGTLM